MSVSFVALPAPVVSIDASELSGSYTVDFAGIVREIHLNGTLTGDCEVTFENVAPGCKALLIVQQDATGDRSLTIASGSSSSLVCAPDLSVLTTPNYALIVEVMFSALLGMTWTY
jgi:hypothetical protein